MHSLLVAEACSRQKAGSSIRRSCAYPLSSAWRCAVGMEMMMSPSMRMGQPGGTGPMGKDSTSVGAFFCRHSLLSSVMYSSEHRTTDSSVCPADSAMSEHAQKDVVRLSYLATTAQLYLRAEHCGRKEPCDASGCFMLHVPRYGRCWPHSLHFVSCGWFGSGKSAEIVRGWLAKLWSFRAASTAWLPLLSMSASTACSSLLHCAALVSARGTV